MSDTVQDGRRTNFFLVDNAVIDGYGAEVGAVGIAVYAVLARMADRDGASWPAVPTVAKRLGVSEDTARRAIARLQAAGLVVVTKRGDERGQFSNLYTLTHVGAIPEPAPRPAAGEAKPAGSLWDRTVGAVEDAGDDQRKQLGAALRVWGDVFGPSNTTLPQLQGLATRAGGPAELAKYVLKVAATMAPPINNPYGAVRWAIDRDKGTGGYKKPEPPRRATTGLDYAMPKANQDDGDEPF